MGDDNAAVEKPTLTYANLRLALGISCVGTFVTLSVVALAFGWPGAVLGSVSGAGGAAIAFAAFIGIAAAVHLPFDVLGGSLLASLRGRSRPEAGAFVAGLARGVLVYSAGLWLTLMIAYIAGSRFGLVGVIGSGAVLVLVYLTARPAVARMLASLADKGEAAEAGKGGRYLASADEGFTGGFAGAFAAGGAILPDHWRERLAADELEAVVRRRELAASTGAFTRGRVSAAAFTVAGIAISAVLVGEGAIGTAAGTVELSLWFTLWSFLGLLTLPTLSRRGVAEVDAAAIAAGVPADAMARAIQALDRMQDDEMARTRLVETVFHPLPSVSSRLAAAQRNAARPPKGAWDAARSAVYLNLAGGGLLGRAVHCNCGRPALWAFLPAD